MTAAITCGAGRSPLGRACTLTWLCALAFGLAPPAAQGQNALEKLKRKLEAIQQPGQQQPAAKPGDERPSPQQAAPDEREKLGGLTPTPAGFRQPALPDRLEAVGVRIGMPAEAAVAALRAHNPALRLRTEQIRIGGWSEPAAWLLAGQAPGRFSGSPSEDVFLRLALPPSPSLVTELVRVRYHEEGAEPPVESVLDALRAKYGPNFTKLAGDSHGLATIYVWRLDGQRLDPSARGCYERASTIAHPTDLEPPFEARLREQERLAQLCGAVVSAYVAVPLRNRDLVAMWSVRLSSEPLRAAALKATVEHLKSIDAARRGTEVQKAKGVQVKI